MSRTLAFLIADESDFTSARLTSLYSDLDTLKSINPDGFRANIATWHVALSRALEAGAVEGNDDRLVLQTGARLMEALRSKEFGIPSAVSFVIHDGLTKGSIIPLKLYLDTQTSVYEDSWLSKPWHIFQWGMQHLRLLPKPHVYRHEGSYVLMKNIEDFGNRVFNVLSHRDTRVNRIIPRELFEREICSILNLPNGISSNDISCLLAYLSRDRTLLAFDEQVVKIKRKDGLDNEIETNDRDMASVQLLMVNLTDQVRELSRNVERHSTAAHESVSNKNRTVALRHLKSRKLMEEMLTKRTGMLLQVEAAWAKIEEAASHVEFIRTMEQTTSALRALHAETGGMERVDNVVDAFNEEMMRAENISSTISDVTPGIGINESEIDQELADLEAQNGIVIDDNAAVAATKEALLAAGPVPSEISRGSHNEDKAGAGAEEGHLSALHHLSLSDKDTHKDVDKLLQPNTAQ